MVTVETDPAANWPGRGTVGEPPAACLPGPQALIVTVTTASTVPRQGAPARTLVPTPIKVPPFLRRSSGHTAHLRSASTVLGCACGFVENDLSSRSSQVKDPRPAGGRSSARSIGPGSGTHFR